MKVRFFRLSAPNKFGYKPLYYKPEQEELEERIKRAEGNTEYTKTADGKVVRTQFQFRRSVQADSKQSTKRLLFIITGLVILSYWLLKGFWAEIINFVL
ncbi:MAG: hypothetical protein RIS47_211 [Bacteroidota bacterium]|jgi:DNA/RNA-binding domain of Phe-tRNA-synthetase-like protein